VRQIYSWLLRAAVPLILARLWWRGRREPGYRQAIGERFGRYTRPPPAKVIWLHAVSVGEARAAAPLVQALRSAMPDYAILFTCMTAAGRDTLRQIHGDEALVAYVPYDLPGAVDAFLAHWRPRLAVLMETELWPNLLAGCSQRGVPVLLANARMSEKSARRYAAWPAFTRETLARLTRVCAQSEDDAQRLRALGARNVEVTGNLKFDAALDPSQLAAGRAWREKLARPVLLLASTREGEEALLFHEINQIQDSALPLIVVVPRHPRRFDEVAQFAQARRSAQPMPDAATRVYLGDTMGEMAFYYAACDVAVIGGSFQPLGGQNLIEALAAGAPVVTGPSMFNFAEATRLALKARAAVQAPDAAAAVREAMRLLEDPARRAEMAAAGRRLCEAHRGATARHLATCRLLLSGPG
jgi:3-deoxy-D-manno-octulosonic-acid transferase